MKKGNLKRERLRLKKIKKEAEIEDKMEDKIEKEEIEVNNK